AATDDGTVAKLIFGVLVFVVWGIGALVSVVKKQKKQEQERQRVMMEQVRREMQAGRATQAAGGARMRPAAAAPLPPQPPTYRPPVLPDWLTPRTMRSQFILTEVLQPPLALREPQP